jgi:urea transport system substrate-binding protein
MGIVFRAYDPRLDCEVALKVMKPELSAFPDFRQRFLREAKAMAALRNNEHVVMVHQSDELSITDESGQVNTIPFLVMELLRGEPLSYRLRRQRQLPWREAVDIAQQTAQGLCAAHQRGLIHRDIKPSNIWLEDLGQNGTGGRHERVKILDFGLVRVMEEDGQATKVFLGTPAYTNPEQAAGKKVDARTDLFSLGTVLYEMVTGTLPWKGKAAKAILRQVKMHHPPPAIELAPEIPPALSRLIDQLLAKDPEERPDSAQEVSQALSQLIDPKPQPPSALPSDALARIMQTWETLPGPIRRAILALVESAG